MFPILTVNWKNRDLFGATVWSLKNAFNKADLSVYENGACRREGSVVGESGF